MNEAEACRPLVRPRLEAAGWEADGEHLYEEPVGVTGGGIVAVGGTAKCRPRKVPDVLLGFTRDVHLAVVEAKAAGRPAADGLRQAKDYACLLGLKFAYATSGTAVVEYDFLTSTEAARPNFPTPAVL